MSAQFTVSKKKRLILGVVAGSVAIILSFFMRMSSFGIFLPEMGAQSLISQVPGQFESQAVATLRSLAKYLAILGSVVVNLLLYGLLAVYVPGAYCRRLAVKKYIVRGVALSSRAYITMLVVAIVLFLSAEVRTQSTTINLLAIYLIPPSITYGFLLGALYNRILHLQVSEKIAIERKIDGRRRLIITAAAGTIASLILFYWFDLLFKSSNPPKESTSEPKPVSGDHFADRTVASLVASEVTPNDLFYTVDVNVVPPNVDASKWKLTVKGLVERPLTFTFDELKSLPSVEKYNTLECISNEIGGDLISNALWKGVRLKDIIEKTGVKPETQYIIFRCSDNYDVGIPLEKGVLDGTLLAYEMNGTSLPVEHGYPLRAIVPGLYGMMNAKWITEIEFVNRVHEGFWQRRGWANNAEYLTHSMIVVPGTNELQKKFRGLEVPKPSVGKMPIAGIAFAGDRGISKVELSADGGKTWQEASIKNPLSGNTWVLWATQWNPQENGRYRLMVRATDKKGRTQTAERRESFPDGATGYHTVDITVESSA